MRSPASSRSQSPAPDDAAAQDAYARLGKLLNLNQLDTAQQTNSQENGPSQTADNEDEEQEFEFRLFSAPAKSTKDTAEQSGKDTDEKTTEAPTIQKLRIRLHSPTTGSGAGTEGRFVKSFRGWDYYFSTPSLQGTRSGELTAEEESRIAEKKKQFEDMAVSGQHMLTWANSLVWVRRSIPVWQIFYLLTQFLARLPSSLESYPSQAASDQNTTASQQSSSLRGKGRTRL